MGFVNAHSINASFAEINDKIVINGHHIFGIAETWLTPSIPSNSFEINSFNFIHHDRGIISKDTGKYIKGGGLACYIHSSYNYKIVCRSNINNINAIHYMFIEINSSTVNKFLLILAYRRPSG